MALSGTRDLRDDGLWSGSFSNRAEGGSHFEVSETERSKSPAPTEIKYIQQWDRIGMKHGTSKARYDILQFSSGDTALH